jgi:hypothetical protein
MYSRPLTGNGKARRGKALTCQLPYSFIIASINA